MLTEKEKNIKYGKNPDISVIIPVYNCELFLKECLQSIMEQDVDLEIVCVDDGSTDHSQNILKEMANEDTRLRWYGQNHAGAALARNFGIELAVGEYVAFADADDYYLEKDALRRMLQKCRDYGVDACGSVMSLLENQIVKEAANYQSVENIARKGILQYTDYQIDYDFTTFIFKKSVIINHHISFPKYGYYEDPPFLVRVLFAMKKFVMSDARLYCYRTKPSHILGAEKCIAALDGIKENLLFAQKNDLNKLFRKTLLRLEYEYGDRILSQLNPDHMEILEKLIDINRIVNDGCNKKNMIRPIRKLAVWNQFAYNNYKEYLNSILEQKQSIYIYGAGVLGRKFGRYVSGAGMRNKIKGFIVTSSDFDRALEVSGFPVWGLQDILHDLSESYIFIAVGPVYVSEIVRMLELQHIENYEVVDAVFLNDIQSLITGMGESNAIPK